LGASLPLPLPPLRGGQRWQRTLRFVPFGCQCAASAANRMCNPLILLHTQLAADWQRWQRVGKLRCQCAASAGSGWQRGKKWKKWENFERHPHQQRQGRGRGQAGSSRARARARAIHISPGSAGRTRSN